jgi:endonuclease YncB( thermonuclease family)
MPHAAGSGKLRHIGFEAGFPLNGIPPLCEHSHMFARDITKEIGIARHATILLCGMTLIATIPRQADAAGCIFQTQSEGHVVAILDARTFRLSDNREIRLEGIEPVTTEKAKADRTSALARILTGRDVTLSNEDTTPDRYGRQHAFVFLGPSKTLVQSLLLAEGEAFVSTTVTDKDCASILTSAETEARRTKKGVWAEPSAIKNAESPGDILAGIGRFAVIEGKVLSVRQAGATTYLNFGRNWTQDFAVTISRRILPAFEAAGIVLKSFENRRVRIRGWVENHGGPRIEVLRVEQIEVVGGN